ncbi:extracellular basic protease precursor [bacterium BMS3Abin07]|nr:extracellular basic protease precursor [bacterium BMS3Abin07]
MRLRDFESRIALWFVVCLFLSLTPGCGGGGGGGSVTTNPPPPAPTVGSVTGTLTVSNVTLPASISSQTQNNKTEADIVPGEIIVRFKGGVDEDTALTAILNKYKSVGMVNAGPVYPNGPYLLRTNAYQNIKISSSDAKKQTEDVILELKAEPVIKYAEPNGIAKPQMMPNDPASLVGLQWDMSMINLPTAWELTQGSSSVIVAVLDTGIRSHPDLDPNVLSTGYDFVNMDSDPTDPLLPTAEFHGTHVAGTIAAIGNNNSGMAGVAWNVKIMPMRVLGPLGGTDTTIINGMLYAAGLPNSSGQVPPQHANVINMSLGGNGTCSASYQDVINQVTNAGVTIVVAAGNDFQNGNPITWPASCQGVIAVGAVDPIGQKASYSESQPYVFIAAPGGDEGEGIHAGILSTLPVSTAGGPYYKFMQGTSMATPHVSGVIALMLSVTPALTPSEIKNILSSTADPDSINYLSVPNNDIGYGLIDAGKAVASAAGVSTPSVPVPYPWPSLFNFLQITGPMHSINAIVLNTGGATLSLTSATPYVSTPAGGTWLSVSLDSSCSAVAPSSNCPITYNVDPTGLTDGEYVGAAIVTSNGGNFAIPVVFQIGATPSPTITEPVTVQLWNFDTTTLDLTGLVASTTTDASQNYNYAFQSVSPGNYVVVAGVDKNGDGVFGDASNEIFTLEPKGTTVTAGQSSNVDLQIRTELDDITHIN